MIRATTPKHSFRFKDYNPEEFKTILITYSQGDSIILEKEKTDLSFETSEDGKYVAWFRMTQDEANMFKARGVKQVSVQIRALTIEDHALASDICKFNVEDVLDDRILT